MKFVSILFSTTIVAITIQKCRARYLLVETSDVTDNDASNRIPSSCDLITKEKTCSILFQEFEKLIDGIAMNTTVDSKFKNGYKQYMKSNFCGKYWNKMIKLDDWKIITCKADTPGNVKQSCPDICNGLKPDEPDISEEGSDEDSSEESSEEDSSEESSEEESKEKGMQKEADELFNSRGLAGDILGSVLENAGAVKDLGCGLMWKLHPMCWT